MHYPIRHAAERAPLLRPAAVLHRAILFFLPVLLLAGCVSAGQTPGESRRGPSGGYLVRVGDVEAGSYSSVEELILARVPGVYRSPEGTGIMIRGAQSVNGPHDPLYVIDGVPSNAGAQNINLYDVREIEVISSTSQTATFGMRGVNGVIMIRTKSGND